MQKYFHSKSQLFREVSYKGGTLFGVQNTYGSNGKLEEQETINENGKLDGEYLKYGYKGSLEIKGRYDNGNKIGIWEHFGSNHEPNLMKKCVYDGGTEVCEKVDYYDHGGHFTAKSFTTYVKKENDRYPNREGAFTSYYDYEKKRVKEKGSYKNGEKFGPWVSKDDNGNIICNVIYLDNGQIKDQEFAYFSDSGVKISDGANVPNYSCGGDKVHKGAGHRNRYDDDGKPSSEEVYLDGELVADKIYEDGLLEFERKFNNGERIAVTGYDKKERVFYKWKLVNNATFYEQFDHDENIHDSGYISEDKATPSVLERTIRYDTGEVLAKGNIERVPNETHRRIKSVSGMQFSRIGVWKTYYKNGNLKTSGSYKDGEPVGIWVKYDEQGKEVEKVQKSEVMLWQDSGKTKFEFK